MPSHEELTQDELGIIGQSRQIREAVETLRRVAPTDIGVLLIGESGVGKEVFARAIHRMSKRANARLIATSRALDRDVQRGGFRQDLYYRLRSACLTIPPLRERTIDIPLLVEHFADQVSQRLGTSFPGITPEAMDILIAYPWPGNIRELR